MKLYIPQCYSCNSKISLSITAFNRQQIRYAYGNEFTIQCPTCYNTGIYTPHSVRAETDKNSKVGGGVAGGLIGLLGGPLGVLIGAGLGTLIGNTADDEDKKKVNHFNSSY